MVSWSLHSVSRVVELEVAALSRVFSSLTFSHKIACCLLLRCVRSSPAFPDSEYNALYDFYNATHGADWDCSFDGALWQWVTKDNPCTQNWQGVYCTNTSSTYHVVELYLPDCHLVGTIPSSFVELMELQYLELGLNSLYGHLPPNFGQLSYLQHVDISNNNLVGSLPDSISNLTLLQYVSLSENRLTGQVPSQIDRLGALQYLDLSYNLFNCTNAHLLGNLTQLLYLDLNLNQIPGTIPVSLGNLTLLQYLDLTYNRFSGSVPVSLSNLTQLAYLFLGGSDLTGTVPAALFMPQLQYLSILTSTITGYIPEFPPNSSVAYLFLNDNIFSGTIPASFGQLTNLIGVSLAFNALTGSLPTGAWPVLFSVDLSFNTFTGSVNDLFTSQQLNSVYLQNNMFTGTLSTALSEAFSMEELVVTSNYLHGAIPPLNQLPLLATVSVQDNHFSGSLSGMFDKMQEFLLTIQLDNNQFTGTLPREIFTLPALTSLSIVGSCLHGMLPDTICDADWLQTLILYGLTTGSSCRAEGVSMLSLQPHRTFGGALPSCLLQLPKLKTLLLSSNGLTGELSHNATVSAELFQLDLSRNLISGTIPHSIQNHTWLLLDLSHNKLSGTLESNFFPRQNASVLRRKVSSIVNALGGELANVTIPAAHLSPALTLNTNRLSGGIPDSVLDVRSLSVLSGNLFACNYEHSNLPQHDSDVTTYECASNAFDVSVYVWLGAVLLIVVCGMLYRHVVWVEVVPATASADATQRLEGMHALLQKYRDLARLSWCCACAAVVVLMPYYAVISQYEGTHTHQYAYVLSAIYTSGVAAFTLDSLLWALLLCGVAVFVWYTYRETEGNTTHASLLHNSTRTKYCVEGAFAVVNVTVVLGVNIAFVYIVLYGTSRAQTAAQVALSIFKTMWNTAVSPYVLRRLSTYYLSDEAVRKESFFTLQLFVALFNNIAIPCLVVMAIDPNCFSNILLPHQEDSVKFLLPTCYNYGDSGSCSVFTYASTTVNFSPPFTYSYQCSASFVTSYAPAFVYMSLSTVLLTPVVDYVLLQLYARLHTNSVMHRAVTYWLPRLLKPPVIPVPSSEMVGATSILVTLFTHLGILLTFGVVFPPVALAMAVSITAVVYMTRYKLHLFLKSVLDAHVYEYFDLLAAECAKVGSRREIVQAVNSVVCYCCAFYTLFLFDTLGDARGFRAAVWVLIVVPLAPFVVIGMSMFRTSVKREHIGADQEGVELKVIDSSDSSGVCIANPIQADFPAV